MDEPHRGTAAPPALAHLLAWPDGRSLAGATARSPHRRGVSVTPSSPAVQGRTSGVRPESFLALPEARLTGPGLYVLDEPEAALSPVRQLAFLSLLKGAVARGAQFVIATHAPILMAYPGARRFELTDDDVRETEYDDLEHVRTLRAFLDGPEAFVRYL